MASYLERSHHNQAAFWERYEFAPFVGKSDDESGPTVELIRYVDKYNRQWQVKIFLAYCSGYYSDHSCEEITVGDPLLPECLECLNVFVALADEWNEALS